MCLYVPFNILVRVYKFTISKSGRNLGNIPEVKVKSAMVNIFVTIRPFLLSSKLFTFSIILSSIHKVFTKEILKGLAKYIF